MFCKNCGKQIDNNAKFCSGCGMMTGGNTAVTAAVTDTEQTKGKKLWSKKTVYIIGAAALAVFIAASVISFGVNFFAHRTNRSISDRMDSYFDGRKFGEEYPWEYFDDDDDYGSYGRGYGGRGTYGGGAQIPNASAAPSATPAPWWPADENGKYPTDSDYKWPAGDDKYEYYTNSTIPKFESVTGKQPVKIDTDNGNTYYTYDLDETAYNEYVKVLKERGFKQSDFEVKGKDSYEKYMLGDSSFYEYLIIYHMNSENRLIIMA